MIGNEFISLTLTTASVTAASIGFLPPDMGDTAIRGEAGYRAYGASLRNIREHGLANLVIGFDGCPDGLYLAFRQTPYVPESCIELSTFSNIDDPAEPDDMDFSRRRLLDITEEKYIMQIFGMLERSMKAVNRHGRI